ncbi:hypothetical protein ACBQ24_11920 [Acinetobacter terrestris]|uniref:hypothetical protein n=1 Tax=Acinetobacter terrestris TaxID=2529843 RepID=UPI00103B3985|nr:hypothetical protein [Acinetobacter terrestris]TCB52159.1 hypothetical protein E0H84_13515 [Acinetobacter terrestris]
MKIFVQSAAFLAVLLGSGLSQAATTTASIPMGVEVPKSCTFSNVSTGIVVPEDGSEAVGNFTYSCNMDYGFTSSISLDSIDQNGYAALKNPNGQLPISVQVSNLTYYSELNKNEIWTAASGFLNYIVNGYVKIKLRNPVTAITPAGVYSDTFRITLTY